MVIYSVLCYCLSHLLAWANALASYEITNLERSIVQGPGAKWLLARFEPLILQSIVECSTTMLQPLANII